MSRSVTVVLAYQMWSERRSLKTLYQELKDRRPEIRSGGIYITNTTFSLSLPDPNSLTILPLAHYKTPPSLTHQLLPLTLNDSSPSLTNSSPLTPSLPPLAHRPNPGFMDQLRLWEEMGCSIREENKKYRAYRLQCKAREFEGK